MRGRLVIGGLSVFMLLAGTGVATADLINQSSGGGSWEHACLTWYDTEGTEQGSANLCGFINDYGYGEHRTVRAERWVQTCDPLGQQCTDAYSEQYSGPADATEFSMDIVAGTATFAIVLAGESASDQCTVSATAQATGAYSGSDPYPTLTVYGNPGNPSAQLQQGDDTYSAWVSPTYPSAWLSQSTNRNVSRNAAGSGSVCNWVQNQASDGGAMWANSNTYTSYSVTPTQLP